MADADEFRFTAAKKPIRILSLFFGMSGILLSLIVAFLVNDALGKTEQMLLGNLDNIYGILVNTGNAVAAVEAEVSTIGQSIDTVNSSIISLSTAVEETGTAISAFTTSISSISLLSGALGDTTTKLGNAANYLGNTSKSLRQISSSTGEHKKNIDTLRSSLADVRNGITAEAQKVNASKAQLSSVFGLLKIANIILFVMFFVLFLVLILNSVAGLL